MLIRETTRCNLHLLIIPGLQKTNLKQPKDQLNTPLQSLTTRRLLIRLDHFDLFVLTLSNCMGVASNLTERFTWAGVGFEGVKE
jgi:hypothetical protein